MIIWSMVKSGETLPEPDRFNMRELLSFERSWLQNNIGKNC